MKKVAYLLFLYFFCFSFMLFGNGNKEDVDDAAEQVTGESNEVDSATAEENSLEKEGELTETQNSEENTELQSADNLEENTELLEEDIPVEPQFYVGSNGFLRLQTTGKTQTALVRTNTQFKSRIIVDTDSYTQRDYDALMRTTQELVYAFPTTSFSANTKPLNGTIYFYEGESAFAEKVLYVDYVENTKTETHYSADNKPVRQLLFEITETTQRKLHETQWFYDALGNIIEEVLIEPRSVFTTKYTYIEGHKKPDVEQFNNEELISKTLFDFEGVIKEHVEYFSDGISIQTLYQNGKRNKQTVFTNGKVLRELAFE